MWLGNLFWKRVGVDKDSIISLLECQGFEAQEYGGFIKLFASDEVFTDDSAIEKQRFLRQMFMG